MASDGALRRPQANESELADTLDVCGELRRLAARYPAFRFGTNTGWDRKTLRWVAERIDGLAPGLHTAITSDLDELRAALDDDERCPWPSLLTREVVLRALL